MEVITMQVRNAFLYVSLLESQADVWSHWKWLPYKELWKQTEGVCPNQVPSVFCHDLGLSMLLSERKGNPETRSQTVHTSDGNTYFPPPSRWQSGGGICAMWSVSPDTDGARKKVVMCFLNILIAWGGIWLTDWGGGLTRENRNTWLSTWTAFKLDWPL
jgi:hypothetical protein